MAHRSAGGPGSAEGRRPAHPPGHRRHRREGQSRRNAGRDRRRPRARRKTCWGPAASAGSIPTAASGCSSAPSPTAKSRRSSRAATCTWGADDFLSRPSHRRANPAGDRRPGHQPPDAISCKARSFPAAARCFSPSTGPAPRSCSKPRSIRGETRQITARRRHPSVLRRAPSRWRDPGLHARRQPVGHPSAPSPSAASPAHPGAQLGECSISRDGEWLTAAFKADSERGLVAGRFDGSGWHTIPFPRTVIHPQFHPLEPEWIEFSGDPAPRMHRVRRDGTGLECLYQHGNDEFLVHETFLGQHRRPGIHRSGRAPSAAWIGPRARSAPSPTTTPGTSRRTAPAERILCDTNHPDEGLQIIDAATGARRPLCLSESSNQGTQWRSIALRAGRRFRPARATTLSWMETPPTPSTARNGPTRTLVGPR